MMIDGFGLAELGSPTVAVFAFAVDAGLTSGASDLM